MFLAQRVLVFIEMDEHIADFCAFVAHGIIGGAVQVADLRGSLEQVDERQRKLRLASAFLAIDIQYWEGAGRISDDVPKQCGKIKADGHCAIVPI